MIILEDEYCIVIDNVFNDSFLKSLKRTIQSYEADGKLQFSEDTGRYTGFDISFIDRVHLVTLPDIEKLVASKFSSQKIKPSYAFVSSYKGGATLGKHQDREQCEYTASFCLTQSEPWSFFIRDKEYVLEENQLILFKGREHPHYRNPLRKNQHCCQILFHFVYEDFEGRLGLFDPDEDLLSISRVQDLWKIQSLNIIELIKKGGFIASLNADQSTKSVIKLIKEHCSDYLKLIEEKDIALDFELITFTADQSIVCTYLGETRTYDLTKNDIFIIPRNSLASTPIEIDNLSETIAKLIRF